VLSVPAGVFGCSCTPPPPPAAALRASDIVFTGIVIGSEAPGYRPAVRNGDTTMVISSGDMVRYTFEVLCMWKGAVADTLEVYTARGGASCGYPFEVGKAYLVYGRIYEKLHEPSNPHIKIMWPENVTYPLIRTGICSRTKLFDKAADDLAELPIPFCK
jgi:hypothetical protein